MPDEQATIRETRSGGIEDVLDQCIKKATEIRSKTRRISPPVEQDKNPEDKEGKSDVFAIRHLDNLHKLRRLLIDTLEELTDFI